MTSSLYSILFFDDAKIGLDDHMERVFKALASVQMTISLIFCFLSYIRYSEINDRYQTLYDRGESRQNISDVLENSSLACVLTYGLTGIAAGIFGLVAVNANLLYCFRTFVVLSFGVSVFSAGQLLLTWLFAITFC